MLFTQPTLHHILYTESDTSHISRDGFLRPEPKSIWVEFEDKYQRESVAKALAKLHKDGILKWYIISACQHGDDSSVEDVHDELRELARRDRGAMNEE